MGNRRRRLRERRREERDGAMEVERQSADGRELERAGVHANSSTFDEMRAREIKVERGRRTCVGRISGSALSCGRVERLSGRRRGRRMDGRFCHTFFYLSWNWGERAERASAFLHKLNFVPRSLSVPSSFPPSVVRCLRRRCTGRAVTLEKRPVSATKRLTSAPLRKIPIATHCVCKCKRHLPSEEAPQSSNGARARCL